jgi:hypothetical protein
MARAYAQLRGWPLDPAISTAARDYGWQSPTFVNARVRTALWVLVDAAGVAVPAGGGSNDPAGSTDEDAEAADGAAEVPEAVTAAAASLGLV